MSQDSFADEAGRRQAVAMRDSAADGRFFFAVLSTGIYCYPSCAARAARPDNLRFFNTREEAVRAGYRPCRRCLPDLAPRATRQAAAVAQACRAIDAGCLDLGDAAALAGLSVAQFRRVFRRLAGVTPVAYAAARRQRVAKAALRAEARVTDAIYEAGFSSSGRFYEAADGMLGMTPTAWRAGGAGERIDYACGRSALGQVLVAATGRGICAILLGDDDRALLADLGHRFPHAHLAPADAAFAAHLDGVIRLVEAPGLDHALPLDIRGTAFQRRVWQALQKIPAGVTQSYGELATSIGLKHGARAVASACAANPLAVAVPCHRVVATDARLAGYRWGLARKRALLEREAGRGVASDQQARASSGTAPTAPG